MNKREEQKITRDFWKYNQLLAWYSRRKASFVKQVGIRLNRMVGQGQILSVLEQHEPIAQKELVAKLDMKPQSASEIIQKLEKKGLVKRWKSPEDKRAVIVSLTSEGKQEIENFDEFSEISPILLEGLTEDEKADFARLIAKLQKNLDAKVAQEDERLRKQYEQFNLRGRNEH